MIDYPRDVLIAFLTNKEAIDTFILRISPNLMPNAYEPSRKTDPEFFTREGNTLWNDTPQTTRVPKKGGFKENLLIMKADIETAREQMLTPEEDMALMIYFSDMKKPGRAPKHLQELAHEALEKIYHFLNGY